jgi:cyclic-di-AMP phosphodiesterase PgpH
MSLSKTIKTSFFFLKSTKGIGVIIFLFTLAVLTGLLASRYYLYQNIIENSVSKRNIYASKSIKIIDTEKTDKRKRDVVKKVSPILTPIQDEYIVNNMQKNLDFLRKIKKSKKSYKNKLEETTTLFDITDISAQDKRVLDYLFKTSPTNFEKIAEESTTVLSSLLNEGVSETDIGETLPDRISQRVNKSFTISQKRTVAFLIQKVIVPNMVIDELATELARRNAVSSIKPVLVTYSKGDKIVSAGELVTKVQKDALKVEGYNILKLNINGILGIFCIVALSLTMITYYLNNFEKKYTTFSHLSLMSLLSIILVTFAVFLPTKVPLYILPFPAVAILLTIFTSPRVALVASVLLVMMIGVALQYNVEAITVFILGAMVAIFTVGKIDFSRRMDLIRTGFEISFAQVLIILGIYLLQYNLYDLEASSITGDVILAFLSGIISAIIALGTLPLIESTFKIITPYGLAELANHNQALLKRLQFEAPGTYHHSLMLCSLAEAAAEAIGADPILVRVGSFYHDIGKLKRPLFFVENQSYFGIENPHEKLNPRLSKMVITAHPKDGVEIAKEYHLPPIIHQFILQHHGDSIASYFYNQALKEGGDEPVTEEQFRYTCPKPSTKEAAIIMIADAVESAVRSLKTPTPEEIDEMINKIIQDRLIDGQFSDSPITLKDLKTITMTFNRILRGMQHHRIKYHENVLEELEDRYKGKVQLPSKKIKDDEVKEIKKQDND